MDLTLSDDQQALAAMTRSLVARRSSTQLVRSLEASEPGYDVDLWKELTSLDLLELPSMVDIAVVCEELGRGPVPSPYVVASALGGPSLETETKTGSRALGFGARPGIRTLAVLEPGMADEWDAPRSRTHKILVPWAAAADTFVVVDSEGVWLAHRTATCERHAAHAGEPLYSVSFDSVAPMSGRDLLPALLDRLAVGGLAYVVGCAERALELAVDHVSNREQFGRPIGAFQAVAHRCADMRADIDACRVLAHQAAWALDRGPAELEVAAAKSYGNEAMRRIFVNAHQVHGALAFSTEYDLHLFTRRAKAYELTYGGTARHRQRLAAAMGLR